MNAKGISSYCQGCGACEVGSGCSGASAKPSPDLIDIITQEVTRMLGGEETDCSVASEKPLIPLGVSNRHLHLTQETFEQLFGVGTEFEVYKELYEPGEFASKHVVTIVGPKLRPIQNVRILGPFRKYDQVEVSLTDAISLGINAPIGDLANGAPLTLVGPKGTVYKEHVAVIANRHVHMSPTDAQQYGVQDGDYCRIRIPGEKGVILENVLVRTDPTWKLMMHLDTDDANAANVRCNTMVEFYGIQDKR